MEQVHLTIDLTTIHEYLFLDSLKSFCDFTCETILEIFCFRLGLITILRNIFSLISIAGCPEAAIKNIYNAVKCGVTHGCTGIVACDWSGKAHLNSHVFSWPAYMLNLGLSWNSNCHQVWQTYQQIISVNNE